MVSMHDGLLPLFPLAVVLLPQNPLPLHIFEERYKEMINGLLETGGEFGVVLDTGRGMMPVGCTATIEELLKRYDDGRMDILTLGRRRFSINSLNQDREFLRGDVTYIEDEPGEAPASLRERALAACRALPPPDDDEDDEAPAKHEEAEPPPASPQLSFHLARRIADLEFRQTLLGIRSESERLERLIAFVPGYVEHARQAGRLKAVASHNGHGKHPPGLERRSG